MKFTNLRAYAHERMLLHRARVLLTRRGLPIVCHAMFRLNRTAQTYPRRYPGMDVIYGLKNLLIEQLYKRGCAEQVRRAEQRFICFRCDGTGIDPYAWDEDSACEKCGGDGIFRTVHLWDFTFRVDGRAFRWHQPFQLVKFDVALTNPDDKAHEYTTEDDKQIIPLRGERLRLMLAVVYVYLRSVGVKHFAHHPKSLWMCIYLDVFAYPHHELQLQLTQIRYRLQRAVFDFKLMLFNTFLNEFAGPIDNDVDDESPF